MVKLYETGAYLLNGSELVPDDGQAQAVLASKGVQTVQRGCIEKHNGIWNTRSTQYFGQYGTA